MLKNYFFLNRFIIEAGKILAGSKLISIFSQEKDMLIIEFLKNKSKYYIEISVNPGFPFINLKENYHRAKKNTIDFFEEITGAKFQSISIADSDRILRISTNKGYLYFLIRGKFTNVCFIEEGNSLKYFKNPPDIINSKILTDELKTINFITHFNTPALPQDLELTLNTFKEKYPYIGKEIVSEAKYRCGNEEIKEIISAIPEIINEINKRGVAVFIDETNYLLHLGVKTFHIFPYTSILLFKDIPGAVNYYISKKYYFEQLLYKKKRIGKHLDKELSRITSKLNNLKASLERGSKEKELNKLGNLLLINLYLIHHGMKSIELIDIYNDNLPITIKLDETLSPKKNIGNYFDKSRSDKIKLEKSAQLYKNTSEQFLKLKNLEDQFIAAKEIEDYNIIMKELKINDKSGDKNVHESQFNFKHYIIEGKYHVFVGKDSKNNDLLTTKFAKQNDYWFHARSVPGSHVVLRVDNNKEIIPKSILKKTASLAAYHSKAKTAGLVPVSYTQKKYVVKKKGMEAGKVALLKEDVLIVKPEIPQSCEFILKD
jgi:predicted ribosome quality control (RQC) complex YloA/Tae2 family protein